MFDFFGYLGQVWDMLSDSISEFQEAIDFLPPEVLAALAAVLGSVIVVRIALG